MSKSKNIQILTFSDDTSMQRMLRQRLEREGYNVSGSPVTAEGLALLSEKQFDIVIINVEPSIDVAALTELRTKLKAETRVAILTSTNTGDISKVTDASRRPHVITKPFDVEDLVGWVNKAAKERPSSPLESTGSATTPADHIPRNDSTR